MYFEELFLEYVISEKKQSTETHMHKKSKENRKNVIKVSTQ